jgi:hypothetical protein
VAEAQGLFESDGTLSELPVVTVRPFFNHCEDDGYGNAECLQSQLQTIAEWWSGFVRSDEESRTDNKEQR